MYVETVLSGVVLPDVEVNEPLRNQLQGKTLDELTEILKSYKTLHNTTDVDTEKKSHKGNRNRRVLSEKSIRGIKSRPTDSNAA